MRTGGGGGNEVAVVVVVEGQLRRERCVEILELGGSYLRAPLFSFTLRTLVLSSAPCLLSCQPIIHRPLSLLLVQCQ